MNAIDSFVVFFSQSQVPSIDVHRWHHHPPPSSSRSGLHHALFEPHRGALVVERGLPNLGRRHLRRVSWSTVPQKEIQTTNTVVNTVVSTLLSPHCFRCTVFIALNSLPASLSYDDDANVFVFPARWTLQDAAATQLQRVQRGLSCRTRLRTALNMSWHAVTLQSWWVALLVVVGIRSSLLYSPVISCTVPGTYCV